MFYSVDRTDEEYAVICDDDGETREIRLFHFEGKVRAGEIYRFENGRFILDEEETAKRKQRINELEKELFK